MDAMGGVFPPLFCLEVIFMFDTAVSVYLNILGYVVPITIVFAFGNIIVSTILRAAFGGRLEFR